MYVYIYMCVCVCVCIHTHLSIYLSISIYLYIYISISIYSCPTALSSTSSDPGACPHPGALRTHRSISSMCMYICL